MPLSWAASPLRRYQYAEIHGVVVTVVVTAWASPIVCARSPGADHYGIVVHRLAVRIQSDNTTVEVGGEGHDGNTRHRQ
ncbi:MAG: hypothetical protein ABSC00_09765 [Acidimicrobiales bacterium]